MVFVCLQITGTQRGVCSCVYCCEGVEEEVVLGLGLLAKREESDR